MIGSTHNHSTGSDGKLTPEEVIKKAISLGWDYIYFTDHYFRNPKNKANKSDYDFFNKKYIQEVKKLKEKYKDKIKVYLGAEIDWSEEDLDWIKQETKKDFDYIIAGIHRLKIDNNYYNIEPGKENWIKNAEKVGGIGNVIREYYKQIKNIIKSGIYDCVGHLDYIRVYNTNNDLFDENADWYKKEVLECLDLIKENKMVMEINHGGIRKTGEQFPRFWIIKEAKKRNIPIALGLDAHHEKHYNNDYLNELIKIAKKAGYNEVVRFENRKMIKEKLK